MFASGLPRPQTLKLAWTTSPARMTLLSCLSNVVRSGAAAAGGGSWSMTWH